MALINKDEPRYIKGLIEYYVLIYFVKLYIFDNNCGDNVLLIPCAYTKGGSMVFNKLYGKCGHWDLYNSVLRKCCFLCNYYAYCDADAFSKISNNWAYNEIDNLFVKYSYSNLGSLTINWEKFGTFGIGKNENESVISIFLFRTKDELFMNIYVKASLNGTCIFIPHSSLLILLGCKN